MTVVDRALVSRIEAFSARTGEAMVTELAARSPHLGPTSATCAGGAAIFMGPGMYVNRALGIGVAGPGDAADVDFLVHFYDAEGVHPEIELCPYADDAIRARAAALGFVPVWFRNIYAREVGSARVDRGADDVSFIEVDDGHYPVWADTVVDAFGGDAGVARTFCAARHATPGERDFLALLDGEVAGVCSMLVRDGIAELGGMGVVPRFRARGVQQASLVHRLDVATAERCDLAIASALPGGSSARNIERAGFSCLYTSAGIRRPSSSPLS